MEKNRKEMFLVMGARGYEPPLVNNRYTNILNIFLTYDYLMDL